MIEAARTTASTGEIWVIVVIMSLVTAFMVGAAAVADSNQTRTIRRILLTERRQRALTGVGAGTTAVGTGAPETEEDTSRARMTGTERTPPRNVPGQRREMGQYPATTAAEEPTGPIPAADTAASVPGAQGTPDPEAAASGRHHRQETGSPGEPPTRPDMPAPERARGRHAMPWQRSGASDRAERSSSRSRKPEEDEPDER